MAESPKTLLRRAIHRMGINVHSYPSNRHLVVDYPVSETPRYGYGRPPHSLLTTLAASRPEFASVLRGIERRGALLASVGKAARTDDQLEPFWNNGWMPPLDGAVLMHFLAEYNPRRYLEIGSGNSTAFARHAVRFERLRTEITSIDPQPRRGIDEACDRVIREPLETIDLSVFRELQAGDILFFDGSHRTFMDSDVTVFFLEVLPSLQPGVFVQIHDIFWPYDYPPEWGGRYYSEQYMLGVYLLNARPQVLMANAFVSKEPDFAAAIDALDIGRPVFGYWGVSFWFTT